MCIIVDQIRESVINSGLILAITDKIKSIFTAYLWSLFTVIGRTCKTTMFYEHQHMLHLLGYKKICNKVFILVKTIVFLAIYTVIRYTFGEYSLALSLCVFVKPCGDSWVFWSAVECRSRNRESPGSNPHLLPFHSLHNAPVHSALYK